MLLLSYPNCFKAAITRSALSRLGLTKISMSPENLGNPCHDTARAPTIRNSTSFARKHSTNSRKSFVRGIAVGPLLESEKDFHSLFGGHLPTTAIVGFLSFFEASEDADDLLHEFHFTLNAA
jgi:hypothetical protein